MISVAMSGMDDRWFKLELVGGLNPTEKYES